MENETLTTKERIIAAVEKLISIKGANDFSLADLANECNISKGTLYYHYPSKDELILDVMEKHMNELSQDYLDWLVRHKDDGISKERFLEVITYKGVKLFNKAKIHLYLINECLSGNTKLKEQYQALWNKWRLELQDGIKTIFPDVKDQEAYAYLLMVLIDGLTIQEGLQADSSLTDRMLKIVGDLK